MNKIVITGGSGFVGNRLAAELLRADQLTDGLGNVQSVQKIVLFDQVHPEIGLQDPRIDYVRGDLNDAKLMSKVLGGAQSVFHFASVVSGSAEADLDLGYRVNLDGTRVLLDILAASSNRPKLVFSSSFAVYSQGKEQVTDDTTPTPKGSYGVQKLCLEYIIGDYSRRGLIDGRSMRFPTIAVRPGKANLANSSFISNIIREPAMGRETTCSVLANTSITIMSPKRLINAIILVHNLSEQDLGWPKSLLLPALNVTVAEMLDALEAELGPNARHLVSFAVDEKVLAMVEGWPQNIKAERAEALGILANLNVTEIVREFLSENPSLDLS